VSSQYKENNFSTERVSTLPTITQHNTYKKITPKIDQLMKRIIDERKQEKKNIMTLGIIFLSIILIFYFF
jgi:dolichol kinase